MFIHRDRTEVEEKLLESLAEKARIEGELETTQRIWDEEANSIKSHNQRLKEEVAGVTRNFQCELLKERDKVINLEQELERAREELSEKEDTFLLDLQAVEDKLEQEKQGKEAAETQLKKLYKATEHSVNQLKKKYQEELQQVQARIASLLEAKGSVERELAQVKKQSTSQLETLTQEVRRLKTELASTRNTLKLRQEEVSRMQLVAIELEREKGRCAGVLASQRTLRAHAAKLEETMATQEAALAETRSNFECAEREREFQQKKASEKIALLESTLKTQRNMTQELRSFIRNEKKEKAKLKEVYQENAQELEETREKLTTATSECQRLVEEVERVNVEVKKYLDQLESVRAEFQESQLARGWLQTQVNALHDEEKVKEDHVAVLQWETEQRQREVEYLKEQLRLVEERQQMELENLKSALQVSRSEATTIRAELSDVRKAKCVNQSEMFQLKDSLLSAKQRTECVRQQLFAKCQELDAITNAIHVATDLHQLKEEVSRDRADNIRDNDEESCASLLTEKSEKTR